MFRSKLDEVNSEERINSKDIPAKGGLPDRHDQITKEDSPNRHDQTESSMDWHNPTNSSLENSTESDDMKTLQDKSEINKEFEYTSKEKKSGSYLL